jgi:hypothetical protein
MIASCLTPQLRCMGCKGLPHGCDDTLILCQQLPHKLQPDASACTKNEPSGEVLIGV